MSDYISREAAVKAAQDGADEWDGGYNRNRDAYIECAIDNVPAADVAEVRHGHWITKVDEPAREFWIEMTKCSVCGEEWGGAKPNYCPNCGARMDESEGEE